MCTRSACSRITPEEGEVYATSGPWEVFPILCLKNAFTRRKGEKGTPGQREQHEQELGGVGMRLGLEPSEHTLELPTGQQATSGRPGCSATRDTERPRASSQAGVRYMDMDKSDRKAQSPSSTIVSWAITFQEQSCFLVPPGAHRIEGHDATHPMRTDQLDLRGAAGRRACALPFLGAGEVSPFPSAPGL